MYGSQLMCSRQQCRKILKMFSFYLIMTRMAHAWFDPSMDPYGTKLDIGLFNLGSELDNNWWPTQISGGDWTTQVQFQPVPFIGLLSTLTCIVACAFIFPPFNKNIQVIVTYFHIYELIMIDCCKIFVDRFIAKRI